MTQRFVTGWQQANPGSRVIYRDIGRHPIPHIDDSWVAAYEAEPETRTPEMQQAIALSDVLIEELMAADGYVFGIPMYNLTVPSTVKSYIDQIVRRDRTLLTRDGRSHAGLESKKMVVITTRKFDYRVGSGAESRDFLEPYLRAIFGVIGITEMTFIHADRLAAEPDVRARSLAAAEAAIDQLAQSWH